MLFHTARISNFTHVIGLLDYVYTRGDFSGFINVSGFIKFRVFGFAGVYTKGYSDSQPFTHIDKSEDIHAGTVTKQAKKYPDSWELFILQTIADLH